MHLALRGGSLVLQDGQTVFRHDDAGRARRIMPATSYISLSALVS